MSPDELTLLTPVFEGMFRTPPTTRRIPTSGSPETASGAYVDQTSSENRPITRSQGPATYHGLPAKTRRARLIAESERENPENSVLAEVINSESENAIMADEAGNQPAGGNGEDLLQLNGNDIALEQNANQLAPGMQNGLPPAPVEPNANQLAPVMQNGLPPAVVVQNANVPANAAQIPQLGAHGLNNVMNVPINNAPFQPPQPNMDDWRHLLRALVRNNLQLPEFSGQDHEDPENFIRGCEEAFYSGNTEMHMRARLASRALKDDAARWFAVYKNLNLTWIKFCELLRNRYASQTTIMRLSAKLYGTPQTEKEGTSLFLEQRHLLARRLFPDAPERQIVYMLIESLRPSTKKLLRSSVFETVGELIIRANQLEQDEVEERNANRRSAQNPAPADAAPRPKPLSATPLPLFAPLAPPRQQRNQPPLLPLCHHCPERHWNRDCPRNPRNNQGQENDRGAPINAADAAPRQNHH